MYKYFISICFLFVFVDGFSQEQKKEIEEIKKDSIIYTSNYGLRLGIDISKPVLSKIDATYNGLEIVGDYRISKRLYVAAELGFEEETSDEDYFDKALTLKIRKFGAEPIDDLKLKQKALRHLITKGFSYAIANKAISHSGEEDY